MVRFLVFRLDDVLQALRLLRRRQQELGGGIPGASRVAVRQQSAVLRVEVAASSAATAATDATSDAVQFAEMFTVKRVAEARTGADSADVGPAGLVGQRTTDALALPVAHDHEEDDGGQQHADGHENADDDSQVRPTLRLLTAVSVA